eukprot:GHVU01099539.1.p1 GENE.GHVU01099539.1~~GHVU01099539.1.p1  ORF type:complete len:118 (-),score=0.22 GHVU01099539.1:1032-1385(-)
MQSNGIITIRVSFTIRGHIHSREYERQSIFSITHLISSAHVYRSGNGALYPRQRHWHGGNVLQPQNVLCKACGVGLWKPASTVYAYRGGSTYRELKADDILTERGRHRSSEYPELQI